MTLRTVFTNAFITVALIPALLAQGSEPVAKALGTIKSISGLVLTVASDSGAAATVQLQDSTRILRTAPGAKDLNGATPITVADLQTGDRVLVRGAKTADGSSLLASSVIVIKGTDVAAKQQQERDDWQKRGVGGLVTAIDPTARTITISNSTMGGSKTTTVHVTKDTIVRRYAPDSVKFDDAAPGTIDQIKAGDQLRARGTRTADGNEFTAEEIVSGSFRNIAGTVISADPSSNSLTVQDLATKKPVSMKINSDSQLRDLPPMVAQRIAARLKGGASAAAKQSGEAAPHSPRAEGPDSSSGHPMRADFQQILSRIPAVSLADLKKGTAVMIVATQGSANHEPTAVTLLTGVEDILTASPNGAAMLLSPWNLGGGDPGANQ
jgi:hypothetical protein